MTTLARVTTGLVIAAVLIGIAAGLWFVISRFGMAIAFYSYVVASCLFSLIFIYYILASRRNNSSLGKELIVQRITEEIEQHSILTRYRHWLSVIFDGIGNGIAWPYLLLYGLKANHRLPKGRSPGAREHAALNSLYPIEAERFLTMALVVSLIILAANITKASLLYPSRFVFMCGFLFPSLKLIAYTIAPISLPTRLRRGPYNQYLAFLVLSMTCFWLLYESLVAISTLFIVPTQEVALHYARVVLGINAFQRLYGGSPLTSIEYWATASGFLYYATILRTFLRWSEFSRSDDDYIVMAGSQTMLGRYSETLDTLKLLNKSSETSHINKAAAFIGLNRMEAALDQIRDGLQSSGLKPSKIMVWDVACTIVLAVPFPTRILQKLVKDAASDLAVPNWEINFLVKALVNLDKIKLSEVIDSVNSTGGRSTTVALLEILQLRRSRTDSSDVESRLIELLQSDINCSFTEKYTNSCLVLWLRMTSPLTSIEEDVAQFETWASQELPGMLKDFAAVEADDDRMGLALCLNELLTLGTLRESQATQECQYAIREILEGMSEELRRKRLVQSLAGIQRVFG